MLDSFNELQELLNSDLVILMEKLKNDIANLDKKTEINLSDINRKISLLEDKLNEISRLSLESNQNTIQIFNAFKEATSNKLNNNFNELNFVKAQVEEENFKTNVSGIFDSKMEDIKSNFDQNFGNEVTLSIKSQIQNSKEDFVDAIYPILGKMVRKYVISTFKDLKEKIDEQIKNKYSFKAIFNRLRGVSASDEIISQISNVVIHSVFIIDKDKNRGIPIGTFSINDKQTDADLLSAQYSAMKEYSQDIFNENFQDELTEIVYEEFLIVNINANKHFYMCVLSGAVTSDYKNRLHDMLSEFSMNEVPKDITEITDKLQNNLSNKLKNLISKFEIS